MRAGGPISREGPGNQVIAKALIHVAQALREPVTVGEEPYARRSRWLMCWALAAAFPDRSPMQWAVVLGLEPNQAAVMLARVRTMRWFSWELVVEAIVILNGARP